MKKFFDTIILAVYIIFILWATIFSRIPGSHGKVMLIPFSAWGTTKAYHRHFIANFFMLTPVGLLLPRIQTGYKSWKKIIIVCSIFSFILETIQYITGTGDFQVDDLWSNTLSGLFGYWFMLLSEKGDI